jgi:hypothetical protein
MTAYSDFKKYEAVLAHCQSSANSELFDSRNHLTQTGSDLAHILLVDEVRHNRIAA